jgi:hypothetical protein
MEARVKFEAMVAIMTALVTSERPQYDRWHELPGMAERIVNEAWERASSGESSR